MPERDDQQFDRRRQERRHSVVDVLVESPSKPNPVSTKFLGWLATLLGIASTLILGGWVIGNAIFMRKDDHSIVEQRNGEKMTEQQVINAKIQSSLDRMIERQEWHGKMLNTVSDNLRKINLKLKIE